MSRIITSILVFLALFFPRITFAAEKLNLYISDIPGQTMRDRDNPGMALALIRKITHRANRDLHEIFLPWSRAIVEMQKDENGMIAPFTRTHTREDNYQWIGELYELEFGFVSLDQSINDKEVAKNLNIVGVWRGSSMEEELIQDGFQNLHALVNDKQIIELFERQRFDAWYGSLIELRAKFKGRKRIGERSIVFGPPVRKHPVWLASSSHMDSNTVNQLRAAMESLRSEGIIDEILRSYGQIISDR
ncbi:MAG: transporter substrate-binding domain-containing protein [Magnetovibrio sp.]|nr:transporter substrate-binding domain-containing protein [Magnetovibrio sp.]